MHGHWLKGYLRDGKEIEGGGGSGGGEAALIVTLSGDQLTADKTFGEIAAALAAGRSVYARLVPASETARYYPVFSAGPFPATPSEYGCGIFDYFQGAALFSVNQEGESAATDYPYFSDGGSD